MKNSLKIKLDRFFSIAIIGTIVSFFLAYSFVFTINFPFQDDLLLLNFVNEVANGVDLRGFFANLFRTDNDHKVVIPRLIALGNYILTGSLNYKFFIVLVWCNLLFIFYFLYIQFKKINLPLVYFIPVPLLFFQPQYYEVSQWAINGMQHSFLTVFFISALYLVSKPSKWAFAGAMFFCFLATFTHGNGVLSFLAIAFYFLCYKDFKKVAVVVVCMIAVLTLYLIGYEKGQAVAAPTEIMVVASNFLGFVGALMSQWNNQVIWPVLWGALILGYSGYLMAGIVRSYFKSFKTPSLTLPVDVKLLTIIAFITLTSLVVAVFRSSQGTTLASRFELYAALGSAVFYLLLLSNVGWFRRKYVVLVVILCSGVINLQSYYRYTDTVADRRTIYQADLFNWVSSNTLMSIDQSLQRNASFYLYPAYERKILNFPEPLISLKELDSLWEDESKKPLDEPIYLEMNVGHVPGMASDTVDFLANDTYHELSSPLQARFLVLLHEGSKTLYMMEASPQIQGRRELLLRGHFYKKGFKSYIRRNNLPAGIFSVGLLDVDKSGVLKLDVLMNKLVLKKDKLPINVQPSTLVVVK